MFDCCGKCCTNELRLHNFLLDHHFPLDFVRPQCGPAGLYPVWSVFFLLFHLCWLGADIYWSVWGGQSDSLYGMRLTNWSVVLLLLYHVTDTTAAIFVYCKGKGVMLGSAMYMPWYLKIDWILFNLSNAVCIIVTIAYWILLEYKTTAGSIYKHGITSLCVLLNITFSAKPVRVWHLIHPVIFSIVYLVTTVIFQAASGTMVYPVLDWDSPGKAIAVSFPFAFIGAPVIHLFVFFLYKIRVSVFTHTCHKCTSKTPVQRTGSLRSVVSENLSIPDDTNSRDSEQTTSRNGRLMRADTSLSVHKFRISFRRDRRIDTLEIPVHDCHVPEAVVTWTSL